jgi:hypothetical protein
VEFAATMEESGAGERIARLTLVQRPCCSPWFFGHCRILSAATDRRRAGNHHMRW